MYIIKNRILSDKEINILLAGVCEKAIRLAIKLGLYCGCNEYEVFYLEIKDIDFENQRISFSGENERIIPMRSSVEKELEVVKKNFKWFRVLYIIDRRLINAYGMKLEKL
ncbi:MAG: hypothetical protein LBF97_07730 [Elusimicrobiota bacterium]|jgi:integrase|nr:hypothetical protein [Elusimicrobiota bacterium]